MYVKKQTS